MEPDTIHLGRMTSLDGITLSLPSISTEVAQLIQQNHNVVQMARQHLPPIPIHVPTAAQRSTAAANEARNREREQLHMLVKEVQQEVERRKMKASSGEGPSSSILKDDTQSKSSGKRWSEGRRHLGFWDPFNIWWRAEYKKLGRRPTSKEINEWHEANAEKTWKVNCPSAKETRKHAKCLRTVEGVRKYFREYRARKNRKEDTPEQVAGPPAVPTPTLNHDVQPPRALLERGISEDLLRNPLYRLTSFPYPVENLEQALSSQQWPALDSTPPY